jgi:hypothetical protein
MAKVCRDGRHYRGRAEECRVIATILSTVDLREKMLKIAADYEQMADAADQAFKDAIDRADLQTLR